MVKGRTARPSLFLQTMRTTTYSLYLHYVIIYTIIYVVGLVACDRPPLNRDIPANPKINEAIETVTGKVIEISPLGDVEGLWIALETTDEQVYYFDFYKIHNPNKYAALSEELEGQVITIAYTKHKQQIAVSIEAMSQAIELTAQDMYEMNVYAIQGKQVKVESQNKGLKVVLETPDGKTKSYLADSTVYEGLAPKTFNGQAIKLSYIEDEDLIMVDWQQ